MIFSIELEKTDSFIVVNERFFLQTSEKNYRF